VSLHMLSLLSTHKNNHSLPSWDSSVFISYMSIRYFSSNLTIKWHCGQISYISTILSPWAILRGHPTPARCNQNFTFRVLQIRLEPKTTRKGINSIAIKATLCWSFMFNFAHRCSANNTLHVMENLTFL